MIKEQSQTELPGISGNYIKSDIVIFGIPFDGTVSNKPGARFGPEAIRHEMNNLETYSPYQGKDLLDYNICDLGNLSLPIGNTHKTLEIIENEVNDILKDDKKIIVLGGEHLVTFPIIKAYTNKFPDIHVLHFDAHTDLRENYFEEKLSHATVMRRVYGQLKKNQLWQFGIRSGTKEEFDFADTHTNIYKFNLNGIKDAIKTIKSKPVYISIDLDVLDPSIFPGTGTPEAGGIDFNELLDGLLLLANLNVVGGDLVELSPHYDNSGVSTAVACKILRELLLVII